MIFDQFLPESTGSWQESTGKKFEKLPVGILLPFPKDFRCFPAGYGDFSREFQDLLFPQESFIH
jgi:hypothetical protein